MEARQVIAHLNQICTDLDAGRAPRRFALGRTLARVAVPAALGLSTLLGTGCGARQPADDTTPGVIVVEPRPVVIVVGPEVCNDGRDNDGDGAFDCNDQDCRGAAGCAGYALPVPPYAAPFVPSEVCEDSRDNDGDGLIDCADQDCRDASSCLPSVAAYAVPLPQAEDCGDGRDNDRDGLIDCSDQDCLDSDLCGPVAEYAAPFEPPEVCHDGRDNDGDGLIDCGDPDCGCSVALYAVPHPR